MSEIPAAKIAKILVIASLLTMFFQVVGWAEEVTNQTPGNGKSTKPIDDTIMRCFYEMPAEADAVTGKFLPTSSLGFVFSLEKNNSNQIAVDIYQLNEKKQKVKQTGHAEVVSSSQNLPADISSVTESPFEFLMEVKKSEDADSKKVLGTILTFTSFKGQTYTELAVECMMKPTASK